MTNSKNRAELKDELKAKTDKLVSQDKELFANLSDNTKIKKERAKGFREKNRELIDKGREKNEFVGMTMDMILEGRKKNDFEDISFIDFQNIIQASVKECHLNC